VDKVALGKVFSDFFGFSPVSIIPLMLNVELHLYYVIFNKRTKTGMFEKSSTF